ncbi:MAG: BstXI family restriction endonuclease [Sulfuricurvum sp.]|nr:BstXI family restriction endonuclease [Sulfuricurvum sp.]
MKTPKKSKIPKLPKFIETKIYKTGQTRGADDDVIYQNRVGRNSTVLIPYEFYDACLDGMSEAFENGFIVLIDPEKYFTLPDFQTHLKSQKLIIGKNALLLYETRSQWEKYNPISQELIPATSRVSPLGGQFISRVASTTSEAKNRENHGFTTTGLKGAGIRVYEYAPKKTIDQCRIQLEYLFWSCYDSIDRCVAFGLEHKDVIARKACNATSAEKEGLDCKEMLLKKRMIDVDNHTVCPLCLEKLSSQGFFDKVAQAEGRSVHDLTVTQINLFHIQELRIGQYNHTTYNLGWGHHHCNVVVKDAGIQETLDWMAGVLERNSHL